MPAAAPLTVLFIANAPSADARPWTAGDGPDPALLRDGLAARGIRVEVARLNRFPLNPLARRGTFYAGFDPVRALGVLLRRRRVDAVVSVGESNLVPILALAKPLRFRPKLLLREISARDWGLRNRVVDYVVPRVDAVLVLTPHQRDWAERMFRLRAPAEMVGFAIDERFFTRSPAAPAGDAVVAVGDDWGRDYPTLIEACRDAPYPVLLRTSAAPPIPDAGRARMRVIGRLSFRELRALYEQAAVVAIPLKDVDHPSGVTSVYEAMAMGCAVVASDVGSTRDLIRHGVNGVLVPPGDAAALRAAIAGLMADPELRTRLGRAARRTIETSYSYDAYVDRFAAAIRRVVAR